MQMQKHILSVTREIEREIEGISGKHTLASISIPYPKE